MSLGKQRAAIDEEMSAEDQRAYEQFIGLYDESMRNLAEGEIVQAAGSSRSPTTPWWSTSATSRKV